MYPSLLFFLSFLSVTKKKKTCLLINIPERKMIPRGWSSQEPWWAQQLSQVQGENAFSWDFFCHTSALLMFWYCQLPEEKESYYSWGREQKKNKLAMAVSLVTGVICSRLLLITVTSLVAMGADTRSAPTDEPDLTQLECNHRATEQQEQKDRLRC